MLGDIVLFSNSSYHNFISNIDTKSYLGYMILLCFSSDRTFWESDTNVVFFFLSEDNCQLYLQIDILSSIFSQPTAPTINHEGRYLKYLVNW